MSRRTQSGTAGYHANNTFNFTTPAQALSAMVDAGAVFTVNQRNDALDANFTYKVGHGGDLELCRQILAHVKRKPPQFLKAFKEHVQHLVGGAADA